MHYYQFAIGDYSSHTSRLTLMEDLAYRRLLDIYYLQETPLKGTPANIARQIGMSENLTEVKYVLRHFFSHTKRGKSERWRNKRADKQIAKYHEKSQMASKAAQTRWRNESGRNADALQTQSQPITNNQEPITNNSRRQYVKKDKSERDDEALRKYLK